MSLTIDSTKQVDLVLFEDLLSELGCVYVDENKFNRKIAALSAECNCAYLQLLNKLSIYSKGKYFDLDGSNECVANTLMMLGVPEFKFYIFDRYKGETKFSMDREKVVNPLLIELQSGSLNIGRNTEAAIDFLEAYCRFRDLKTGVSGGTKKPKLFEETEFERNGNELKRVQYKYTQQATGRYYTSSDNIQGWNKRYLTCLTVPDDKILVWADFEQFDLRVAINLFLRTDENKKILSAYSDKYEALVAAIYDKLGREFKEEEFKKDRPLYKVLALAKLYEASNTTLSASSGDKQVVETLDKFYSDSEKLSMYRKTAEEYIKAKATVTVTDYFGFTREIGPETHNPLSVFLNTPIQATSASIMPIVTMAILNKFYEMGYSSENIIPYLNRHDEVLFMMDKKMLKDIWVIKDFSKIYVDDWDELVLDVQIGDYYKEVNEEYMEIYENVSKEHLGENLEYETKREITSRGAKDYFPIETLYAVVRGENSGTTGTDILKELKQKISFEGSDEEFVAQYPTFKGIEELVDDTAGYTFVINLTKGIAYKTSRASSIEQIVGALGTSNIIVMDRHFKEVQETVEELGVNIINRYTNEVKLYDVLRTLSSGITAENKYFSLNRDMLHNML